MPILKSTSQKDFSSVNGRMVGVVLPEQLCSYITLFTLAKGRTKTIIIKEILQDWQNNQKRKDTEASLINELIRKIEHIWIQTSAENPKLTLREFKATITKELKKKGIYPEVIKQILKEV